MPKPDLGPPPQRGMSFGRWLLLLLPSVPMLVSPLIANAAACLCGLGIGEAQISNALEKFIVSFAVSAVLSVIMGLLLEKWRHGAIEKHSRALSYGFQILVTNFFIAFAGCTVGAIGTMATHP